MRRLVTPRPILPPPGHKDFNSFKSAHPNAARVWLAVGSVASQVNQALVPGGNSSLIECTVEIPVPAVIRIGEFPSDAPDGFQQTLADTFEHVKVVFGDDNSEVEVRWETRGYSPDA